MASLQGESSMSIGGGKSSTTLDEKSDEKLAKFVVLSICCCSALSQLSVNYQTVLHSLLVVLMY